MRKYALVICCAVLVFLVTGCGGNKVKCTASVSEGGVSLNAEVIANLDKDNKVDDVTITYNFDDKSTAESYCSIIKMIDNPDKGITVKCDGKKISVHGASSMDADDSAIGLTKSEFIERMEKEKFTCK